MCAVSCAYTGDMRIAVLTAGRCRKAHLQEGARDYVSRIGRYAALEQIYRAFSILRGEDYHK